MSIIIEDKQETHQWSTHQKVLLREINNYTGIGQQRTIIQHSTCSQQNNTHKREKQGQADTQSREEKEEEEEEEGEDEIETD